MDFEQERKREEYAESLVENKKAREQLYRDLRVSQRRSKLRVIPGGQSKSSK
jgi:hypothetical protein